MEQQDRYIRFDWALQYLLRRKANFGVLKGLWAVLLGEDVEIIELLESENNWWTVDDKFSRVDIKAKNCKGEVIIVEIQNIRELHYLERIIYGVAKAITERISLGGRYYEVKKIYSISILYFDIGKGDDYLYHGQNNFTGVHTRDRLKVTTKEKDALVHKFPTEVFPEYFLIRVNEFNKVAVTPLEEWIEYLKTGCIRSDTTVPSLGDARQKLIYYNMPKEERHAYDEYSKSPNRETYFSSQSLEYFKKSRQLYVGMSILNARNIAFLCADFSSQLFLRHARFQSFCFQSFTYDKGFASSLEFISFGGSYSTKIFGD